MLIRQATMEDYVGVCAVLDEADTLHRQALPWVFREPAGTARSRAYIASIVDEENACLWIAEDEGQIVGVMHVEVRQTRDIPILVPRRYAVIDNLVVSAAYRRRGIGRTLMETADRWALEQGIAQVELHVWEFNKGAHAFYQAQGYRTASRRMWKSLADQETATEMDSP